jgi:hypothetical protein
MRRLNFDERVQYKVSTHACIFNYSQIFKEIKRRPYHDFAGRKVLAIK